MFLFGKKNSVSPEEKKKEIEGKMFQEAKEKFMPYWAVDDAAQALVKRKIATNVETERDRIISELVDNGYIVGQIATKGAGKNNKPKKAEQMVWQHMVTFVDMILKFNQSQEEKFRRLDGLVRECEYMYYYMTDGATLEDAKKVVAGMIEEINEKIQKGEIGTWTESEYKVYQQMKNR